MGRADVVNQWLDYGCLAKIWESKSPPFSVQGEESCELRGEAVEAMGVPGRRMGK